MHWLLNCVCEREGFSAAVLLRGIFAVEGIAQMLVNRPMPKSGGWLNGPAKLCQALGLDGRLNGAPLCQDSAGIWIEAAEPVGDAVVQTTPRIGLFSVPEPWKSIPWRFVVADEHLPYNRDITR